LDTHPTVVHLLLSHVEWLQSSQIGDTGASDSVEPEVLRIVVVRSWVRGTTMTFIIVLVGLVLVVGAIASAIARSARSARNRATMTPLMHAVQDGDTAQVTQLLDSGADVNSATKLGDTALMFAARSGHGEIVRLLIERRADINALGADKKTALVDAIEHGDSPTAQLLVEKGADVNVSQPLVSSIRKSNLDITRLLLERGAKPEYPAMFAAVSADKVEVVKWLIDAGADVNAHVNQVCGYHEDMPPLHIAVRRGSAAMVRLLLESGADPNGAYFHEVRTDVSRPPSRSAATPLDTGQSAPAEVKKLLTDAGAKRARDGGLTVNQ